MGTNMQFTKLFCKNFRTEFAGAVKDLEKKYGITIELGNINIAPTEFTTKLTVSKVLDKAEVEEKEKAEFAQVCYLYDLKPDDYGKLFNYNGDMYKLVAINTRAPKNPYICENESNNTRYRFSQNLFKSVSLI